MRLLLKFGCCLVLAFGMTACDRGDKEARHRLSESVERTVAEESARFVWSVTLSNGSRYQASGVVHFGLQSGVLEMEASGGLVGKSTAAGLFPVGEMILSSREIYFREIGLDGQPQNWESRPGGPQEFLGFNDGMPEVVPSDVGASTTLDFESALNEVIDLRQRFQSVGMKVIDGNELEHFQSTEVSGGSRVRATDVFLDHAGRVRRIVYLVVGFLRDIGGTRATLDFAEFGVPIDLTTPVVP